MKLRQNKAKEGYLMIELMLVSVLVSGALVFVLTDYLEKEAKGNGRREAAQSQVALQEALAAHPINSMVQSINTGVSAADADKRKKEIERTGFNVMGLEFIETMKRTIYPKGINTYKKPVTISASFQFFRVTSEFKKKATCQSFVIEQAYNSDWHSITINGTKLSLGKPQPTPKKLSDLCKSNNEVYKYEMEYCYPTAALPCV